MKRVLAIVLAILCLGAAALAQEVLTTGSVNLRTGPGLGYGIITAVPEGTKLPYLGESSTDERGVAWLKVSVDGGAGWVSTRYAMLTGAPGGEATGSPEGASGADGWFVDPAATVELLNYYHANLKSAAKTLNLTQYARDDFSEVPNSYSNGALALHGEDSVDCIIITGPGYTLAGAGVGMALEDAKAAMLDAGLVLGGESIVGFEVRYPGSNEFFLSTGNAGIIYVEQTDGKVVNIDLESFTG